MSEKINDHYFASGVFKFDHFTAGFTDLQAIAKEWNERDPYFFSLIVRKVSEDNYGIQFVYFRKFANESEIYDPIRDYKNELVDKFGKEAFYAWDFNTSTSNSNKQSKLMLIKHEKLELE